MSESLSGQPGAMQSQTAFPAYSRRERAADAVIHATGTAVALTGTAALLPVALASPSLPVAVACLAYLLSLNAMTGCSAAYNLATRPGLKETLRRIDHAVIYLLIAGTTTPFLATGLDAPGIATLLAGVWLVAAAGMAKTLLWPRRFERLAIGLYLAMGWAGLAALFLVRDRVPDLSLLLIGAGGVFFTIGVGFHVSSRRFHNAAWHLCVLIGVGWQYGAVWIAVGAAG